VIAAITYARKLMMAPVAIVGQAVGAALLPSLTARFQRQDDVGFGSLLTTTLRTTLGLGVMAAGALGCLALPIVQFLYERGEFTSSNSDEVAGLLVILSCAVPGWVLQQVAVRGFYARGEMWRAMGLSTLIAVGVFPLYLWGGSAAGVRGLALASAAAITLNASVTIIWLRLRSGTPDLGTLAGTLLRTLAITAVAVVVARVAMTQVTASVEVPLGLLAIGGGAYLITAVVAVAVLGDAPMRDMLKQVIERVRKR
jgi:putative peptidoglycan lipid II flippase